MKFGAMTVVKVVVVTEDKADLPRKKYAKWSKHWFLVGSKIKV